MSKPSESRTPGDREPALEQVHSDVRSDQHDSTAHPAWLLAAALASLLLVLLGAFAAAGYVIRSRDSVPLTIESTSTGPDSSRPDVSPPVSAPAEASTSAPTSTPADSSLPPVVVGKSWHGLGLPASDVDNGWIGLMEAVTATPSGFVAVGRPVCVVGDPAPTRCQASVWISSAGGAWTHVPDQRGLTMAFWSAPSGPEMGLFDVAAGPTGLVAIGFDARGPGAWHSSDGRTWERVKDPFGPSQTAASPYRLAAVAAGPQGYVIVGHVIKDSGPKGRAAAWASPDGVTWTRALDSADMDVGRCLDTGEEPSCGRMRAVVATGSGFVAVGEARSGSKGSSIHPAAWTSADGRSWTRSDSGLGVEGYLTGVADGDHGVVAVGSICAPDCFGPTEGGLAAVSVDGSTWRATPVVGAAPLQDVSSSGPTSFALGVLEQDVDPRAELRLYRTDDGVAWHRATSLPAVGGAYGYPAIDIATAPDRAVVVGRADVIEAGGADVSRNFSNISP